MITTTEKHTSQEENVKEAFSRQAPVFDGDDKGNPILQWMRTKVRTSVLSLLKKQAHILELNCGTGIDTVFFAEQGFHVTATDIAPGMLEQLDKKRKSLHLEDRIDIQQCSFNNLQDLKEKKFDHVFSNFGGLNCTENLDKVIQDIKQLLYPGGTATLVVMPPICLWELALALKGNFKTAFRRFKKNGAVSHLEGINFTTWYYTPKYIARSFGKDFSVKEIKGLGIIVPPPYLYHVAINHPKLFKILTKVESKIGSLKPFRSFGDHYLISVQKK